MTADGADASLNAQAARRDPSGAFAKALNQHGYGLQYSVLNRARELFEQRRSRWVFEVSEFPVVVQGSGTRIDFILRHIDRPIYLLAECKRANPALSNWCFARAPYVSRDTKGNGIFAERIERVAGSERLRSVSKRVLYAADVYHIAVEIRSGVQGDEAGKGRGAVEEAATQLFRGMNGLVDFCLRTSDVLLQNGEATFIPVIFTTADLWASDVNLAQAELATGMVDPASATLLPKPYVAYNYHQSPGLKHGSDHSKEGSDLGDIMFSEYVRTVQVVGVSGVDAFLTFTSAALG